MIEEYGFITFAVSNKYNINLFIQLKKELLYQINNHLN
jgi:hypothetical protein